VIGTETIDPMMALAIGPCLAGLHEYPGLKCRIVDVTSDVSSAETLAQQLCSDLAEPRQSVVTAYRGNGRWARTIEPIPAFLTETPQSILRQGGVYLITGGAGALGLALARHLAENYQAGVILTGRTALPPREEWVNIRSTSQEDSRLLRIIRAIEEIEAAGGRVMVGAAPVFDLAAMQALVRAAYEKFGDINGVIHAAGVPGTTPIGLKIPSEVDQVLYPKIAGLAVLEQIFADRNLDFVALFSSTSALWGREGQVDYTAANAYLDSRAIGLWNKSRWPIISINWDNWREVGMAVDTLRPGPGQVGERQLKIGLGTADAIRAFGQALVLRQPQVVVRAVAAQQRGRARPGAPGVARPGDVRRPAAKAKAKGYPRPALAQPFQPPTGELETNLAALWSELLMISPLGRDDNFFELGGHSLLALQLLPAVREKYRVALDPRELFANPTIAKLAANIEGKLVSIAAEA
jgi:phthiocerol/phenolphthiocerol synthesis type-I polyketide synthase E